MECEHGLRRVCEIYDLKEEIESLKVQNAGMREALNEALHYFEGEHSPRHPTTIAMQKALSGYDPSWLEGKLREARDKGITEGVSRVWAIMYTFRNSYSAHEFDSWLVSEINKAVLRESELKKGK